MTGTKYYIKTFTFEGRIAEPKVILPDKKEVKAQKALAARNREREQNKLRMRLVREIQRAAREAENENFLTKPYEGLQISCSRCIL